MATISYPGVYVEEVQHAARPIEGVPTSTAAFLGPTERGGLQPRLVTNLREFDRHYGHTEADIAGTRACTRAAVSLFFTNGGERLAICRLVGPSATTAWASVGQHRVQAAGPGAWGRRLWLRVEHVAANGVWRLRTRVAYWRESPRLGLFDPFDDANATRAASDAPSVTEQFDDLNGLDASTLVVFKPNPAAAGQWPSLVSTALGRGGTDGRAMPLGLGAADHLGEPTRQRREPQGLAALDADASLGHAVALLYAPAASPAVARALVAHCEQHRHRMLVVDGPSSTSDASLGPDAPRRTWGDSAYAAVHLPWLTVADPASGALLDVPPGGAVLGIWARVDRDRGLHKSPANEPLRGVQGLSAAVSADEAARLAEQGVNTVRELAGQGLQLCSARTLSSHSEWKYVPVRRLLMFVEASIDRGLKWVVFEPQAEALWARVRRVVGAFMNTVWRQGCLQGSSAQEAYFVRCDASTMTSDDLAQGRLVCLVGVAPVRPAEFIIVRVLQRTAKTP